VEASANAKEATKDEPVTLQRVFAKLLDIEATQKATQEDVKATQEDVEKMKPALDGMQKQLSLLVEATPAAADIPKVFVAGTQDTA